LTAGANTGERGDRTFAEVDDAPRSAMPHRLRQLAARAGAAVLALVLVFSVFAGYTLFAAWRTPGNEDLKAKWADWLRAHDMSFAVNPIENWYYSHEQPPKGGRPAHLNPVPAAGRLAAAGHTRPHTHLPPPAPIPLLVTPGLPGEGRWQPSGPAVDGAPGMYIAQFRADRTYTSQITSAVWIDPTRLDIDLIPGAREPGGTWPEAPYIAPADLPRAVAAFNGGFRFQDANGGFYLDGRQAVPLRDGAASIVLYRDGHIDIGQWGRDERMSPHVEAVLQNLVLLVDHGRMDPTASYDDHRLWGHTLGSQVVIARSGIGITKDGALVYVAGPALTARTLAESLQRAGAVRAMALDLNPEWVTFNFYVHPDRAHPSLIDALGLYPQLQRPATRYLPPVHESRDFFEVLAG
jgi:hypothetical protein